MFSVGVAQSRALRWITVEVLVHAQALTPFLPWPETAVLVGGSNPHRGSMLAETWPERCESASRDAGPPAPFRGRGRKNPARARDGASLATCGSSATVARSDPRKGRSERQGGSIPLSRAFWSRTLNGREPSVMNWEVVGSTPTGITIAACQKRRAQQACLEGTAGGLSIQTAATMHP